VVESGRRADQVGFDASWGLGDVNAADRTDFALHRELDTSLMDLVSAYTRTERSTSNEAATALTAATGDLRAQPVAKASQGERKDDAQD
jgi:hypothetical protein